MERAFDVLLAMSLACWSILGWVATPGPVTPQRVAISALHLTVAFCIARRSHLLRMGSAHAIAASLPALVIAGLAFRLAAPLSEWTSSLQGLFIAGAGIAIVAFLALGESFAILPALRGIVTQGPYRLVRHPAYTGELLMVLSCVLSRPSFWSGMVLAGALPLVFLRIREEERLLEQSEAYRHYAATVRCRLLPGIW